MMVTAMETVPTALPTTDIAMAAGTMGKAISMAVSLVETREAATCKRTATASLYQRKGSGYYGSQTLFSGVLQPLHKFLQGNHISVTFLFHLSGLLTPSIEIRI